MIIRTMIFVLLALLPCLAMAKQTPVDLFQDSYRFSSMLAIPPSPIVDDFLQIPLSQTETTARAIVALDPNLNADVARRAVDAMYCAMAQGLAVDKVIVVDMNVASSQKRLWAFDLKDQSRPLLVINERVAHGSGSDRNRDGKADKFSNVQNSHMTSLGLYKISERYKGKNGWSRRLDGMLAHFNGKARQRAVVMHPSKYVSEQRVGNSQGCPAVNQATMDTLEKAGLSNTVLWIDGPDESLGKEVADCAKKRENRLLAAAAVEQAKMVANQKRVEAAWIAMNNVAWDSALNGLVHVASVDATPLPVPVEKGLVCDLSVPRAPRAIVAACFVPLTHWPFLIG